jgi:hypothetical protein
MPREAVYNAKGSHAKGEAVYNAKGSKNISPKGAAKRFNNANRLVER